jgi:hypothetical protein
MKKNMKRKRQPPTLAEEATDYYNRLVYKCRKDLHKHAKMVRNLERQKAARKVKQQPQQQKPSAALEERLARLKKFDALDAVAHEALRRLGILQLQPPTAVAEGATPSAPPAEPPVPAKEDTDMVENFLKHKRMQDAFEDWSRQVDDYRRWYVQQEERQRDAAAGRDDKESRKKKKGKKGQAAQSKNSFTSDVDYSQSIFLKLGGSDDEEEEEYDAGDNHEDEQHAFDNAGKPQTKPKKNRQGQRARKAKAMAIEAKKAGRKFDASLNWRPEKEPTDAPVSRDSFAPSKSNPHTARPQAAAPSEPTPEELHPSWAARKEQKTGIAAFQGKKITFD